MIVQGDTPSFLITLLDRDGDPFNLTGATVTVTFKNKITDATPLFQHFIEFDGAGVVVDSSGMELTGAITDGLITEFMSIEESEAIAPQSCKGDVEVRYSDQVHTPIIGVSEKIIAGYTP